MDDRLQELAAEFQSAVQRLPAMMADNLYINIDVEQAYAVFAQQRGKTVDELTEQERMQAFLDAYLD